MKKSVFLIASLLIVANSFSVSASQEEISNYFSDFENVTVWESGNEEHKSLFTSIYCDNSQLSDDSLTTTIPTEFGTKLGNALKEDWFDYEYIFVDLWTENFGRLCTLSIRSDDFGNFEQEMDWYTDYSNLVKENQDNSSGTEAELTMGQKNALGSAEKFLNYRGYSYSGLIEILEYDGYTHEEAVFAADNCGADWFEQAVREAETFLNYSSYSRAGLIEMLEYDGFTSEQAEYAVTQCGY